MTDLEIEYQQIAPLLQAAAPEKFVAFCYFYDYGFFKARPFLKPIMVELQRIADGEIDTLGVSLPPRAGKSYLVTLFSAWQLGANPEGSVMRNTCTATLYNKFSYDTRDVVRSERFAQVFPEVRMSADKANVNGWNTNQAKMVSYFGAGVGGTIIGFGATLVAITDDLFRSMEDAMSETIREKTQSWKEATHDSRKESGCKEVDIGTRWTRDDVIGKNVEEDHYDVYIKISAMAERDGEWFSFCEAVMTTQEYRDKKRKMSPEIWAAEYMQEPVDIKGRLFEHIQKFTELEAVREASDGALAYIDVADEGSDFLCALVANVIDTEIFVTDALFTKKNTDYTIPLCARMLVDNNVAYVRVETNGMGAIFLKMLRAEVKRLVHEAKEAIKGMTDVPPSLKRRADYTGKIIGVTNSTNKETRIFLNSAYVLNNFKFLDTDLGEYGQFLIALAKYQHDGVNKNDDAPDAATGLAMMFQSFMKHIQ